MMKFGEARRKPLNMASRSQRLGNGRFAEPAIRPIRPDPDAALMVSNFTGNREVT
ncbi:hypothetical protein [Paraburkholderia caribensis]|uniref:hypothetical protein n=1 Tax=Paraburkholderia caribensis TaxID=75105 RepID=UPI0018F67FF2|nr:hypothetical protein [Paraburkholderia caribensis]